MNPIVIRSTAQRDKLHRIATGEEVNAGLSPDLARASLEAHGGGGVLPERVVVERSERIRRRRRR